MRPSPKSSPRARKLVRVRPADDTTEVTPAAVANGINVALRAQKFDEALALYAKLPKAHAPAPKPGQMPCGDGWKRLAPVKPL